MGRFAITPLDVFVDIMQKSILRIFSDKSASDLPAISKLPYRAADRRILVREMETVFVKKGSPPLRKGVPRAFARPLLPRPHSLIVRTTGAALSAHRLTVCSCG
jgi:hypothetical protein